LQILKAIVKILLLISFGFENYCFFLSSNIENAYLIIDFIENSYYKLKRKLLQWPEKCNSHHGIRRFPEK